MSKLLEKVVASQLTTHLSSNNNNLDEFQSGFKSNTTETALTKVMTY